MTTARSRWTPEPSLRLTLATTRRRLADEARTETIGRLMGWTLVAIVLVSGSPFTPALWGGNPDLPAGPEQQVLTLALWLALVGLGLVHGRRYRLGLWTDLSLAGLFTGWAIVSALWSPSLGPSLMKAAALAVTTAGAYAIAVTLPLRSIVSCVLTGLFVLAAGSLAVVIVWPSVGVISSWMHNGQWSGLFESKQALGGLGAFLLYFAFCHRRLGGSLPLAVAAMGLAVMVVVGSGSRGGGAIATLSLAVVLLSRYSVWVSRGLAVAPVLIAGATFALLLHLEGTGASKIQLLDLVDTDLTERTLIWQFALGYFHERPLFGSGLNGFWTDPELYFRFLRHHGWVLDNFHSGFLAILVELGYVGIALFLGLTAMHALRMLHLYEVAPSARAELGIVLGYVVLVYLFDFTETFFLRSTNLIYVMLVVLYLVGARTGLEPVESSAAIRAEGRPG